MNFNDYSKNKKPTEKVSADSKKIFNEFLSKYNGKSEDEIIDAIFKTAQASRSSGNLSNQEIDNFSNMLLPMLNAEQRKKLEKVVNELKKT